MARRPTPWFRDARNSWFVKLHGRQRLLGEHPKGAAKPKKTNGKWNAPTAILDSFHKLMVDPVVVEAETVWAVFDAFVDWTEANRAPRTYEFYQERLQRFKDAVPNMVVERLTPDHVYTWLNDKTYTYKHGTITALCRAFNWAAKGRKIRFNPIRGIEKPEPANREQIITPAQFTLILRHVKDEPFSDLLKVVWFTGCRPQEAARVEARHVEKGLWRFPKGESKGKRKPRTVFLIPEAEKLTKKWAKRNPEGPIFRNSRGRPAMAFNNRFSRLKEKVGGEVLHVRAAALLRASWAHQGACRPGGHGNPPWAPEHRHADEGLRASTEGPGVYAEGCPAGPQMKPPSFMPGGPANGRHSDASELIPAS